MKPLSFLAVLTLLLALLPTPLDAAEFRAGAAAVGITPE